MKVGIARWITRWILSTGPETPLGTVPKKAAQAAAAEIAPPTRGPLMFRRPFE